jgi:hypothetical protein
MFDFVCWTSAIAEETHQLSMQGWSERFAQARAA